MSGVHLHPLIKMTVVSISCVGDLFKLDMPPSGADSLPWLVWHKEKQLHKRMCFHLIASIVTMNGNAAARSAAAASSDKLAKSGAPRSGCWHPPLHRRPRRGRRR